MPVMRKVFDRELGAENFERANTLISVGSSLTAHGFENGSSRIGYTARCPINWALIQNGQNFDYMNKGISGEFTEAILARLEDDVLKYSPSCVIVQNGTNEMASNTEAVINANSFELYEQILRTGAKLIVRGIEPRNLAGVGQTWTATQQRKALAINMARRNWCAKRHNVFYVNTTNALVDPTSSNGNPVSGYMDADGTHYAINGAFQAGMHIKEILNLLRPSRPLFYDASQLIYTAGYDFLNRLPNAAFNGSSGSNTTGGTGTPPSSWLVEHEGSTATGTVDVTIGDVGNGHSGKSVALTFTPSGLGIAGESETFYFRTNSANTAVSASYPVEAGMFISVSDWAGFEKIELQVDDQDGSGKTITSLYDSEDENVIPQGGWSGMLAIPKFYPLSANQRYRLFVQIDRDAASTGTITLHSPFMQNINPEYFNFSGDNIYAQT